MKLEEIQLNNAGVNFLGVSVGFTPKAGDFEKVFENESIRHVTPLNGRQLRICDMKGLSWLVDLKQELVLSVHVLLTPFRHRPMGDHDPSGVFDGKLLLEQYTVRGPFSCQIGEMIRKVRMPGLSILLVPDGKIIRAVNISFTKNEQQSDAFSHV